jgi:hypothetical protein
MDIDKSKGRSLKSCVAVTIWIEEDGTETVSVVGDDDISALEIKGVLHDGLYAIAHQGEDGWVPVPQ